MSANTLTATLEDQATAKQRANRAYRQRLAASGMCVRCVKRPKHGDAQRCQICTAKAAESAWRRRRGGVEAKRGPAPKVTGWNFDTDELITGHMNMARAMACKAKGRIPSSSTVDVDDMIGDAMLGLVVAGRTFDQGYEVPFGAWATTQIRGAIWDGVRRWNGTGKQRPVFVGLRDADSGD